MGTLYVVGTPIGNLEDLTLRAARILGQVALVAAEDTRVSRKLLTHLGIHVPLLSYHQRNWPARLPTLLNSLASGDVALVTDAGMPGVSDPGSELVARAAAAGFKVEVVPGPSAVTTALAASGFAGDAFVFLGFLPRRARARRELLMSMASSPLTLVMFETPHRLQAALQDLLEVLGDREIAVCRELTKLHEEVFRSTVSGALEHFVAPRGEFVLVTPGVAASDRSTAPAASDLETARQQLAQLRGSGVRAKEAVAAVSASWGLPKKDVYQLWLQTRS